MVDGLQFLCYLYIFIFFVTDPPESWWDDKFLQNCFLISAAVIGLTKTICSGQFTKQIVQWVLGCLTWDFPSLGTNNNFPYFSDTLAWWHPQYWLCSVQCLVVWWCVVSPSLVCYLMTNSDNLYNINPQCWTVWWQGYGKKCFVSFINQTKCITLPFPPHSCLVLVNIFFEASFNRDNHDI